MEGRRSTAMAKTLTCLRRDGLACNAVRSLHAAGANRYHGWQYLLSGTLICVDIRAPLLYTALDLNGQGAPARSGPSRSRRRTSEARRTGA